MQKLRDLRVENIIKLKENFEEEILSPRHVKN